MELKVSAIIILVLFLINSSFSVFYKNNIRGDVNAGDETKYTPIFVIKEEKKIEVVRAEDENTSEEEVSEEEDKDQSVITYNQPTQKQTETPPQQQETSPQEETPQEQPEPTPPAEEEPTTTPNEGSDYAPPPSPFDDGSGLGG